VIDTPAIFIWPVLVAQSIIFGTAAFELIFVPTTRPTGLAIELTALWRVLATLNLVMAPLAFIEIGAGMAQTSWIDALPLMPEIMRETVAGRFWTLRLVVAAALALAMWIPARSSLRTVAALSLSTLLIVFGSLTSHAVDKSAFVIACYAIHQMGAGLWLGALAYLLVSARRAAWSLEMITPRVSTVCASALALIVVSGPLIAVRWLGWYPRLLIDSAWGRVLVYKLTTATPAILLGASNRYWQLPRVERPEVARILVRSVVGECVLLLAVLAWSAFLANTPPPH